jgi:hypothetical protein
MSPKFADPKSGNSSINTKVKYERKESKSILDFKIPENKPKKQNLNYLPLEMREEKQSSGQY